MSDWGPPATTTIEVSVKSGSVKIRVADVASVTLQSGKATIDGSGVVHAEPTSSVTLLCPRGTNVVIGSHSGSVSCNGSLGRVAIATHSGSVSVEQCTSADVRTATGSVHVGSVAGECRVNSKSGRVSVERAPRCDVHTVSGSVEIGGVRDGTVHCASGSVEIGCQGAGHLDVHTISGRVTLTYPTGVSPAIDLHGSAGRVDNSLSPTAEHLGSASITTVSGRVRLRSA